MTIWSPEVIFYSDEVKCHQKRGWHFWDETWANSYGPYDSETDARNALNLYLKYALNGASGHVSATMWGASKENERETSIHSCDNACAWLCMCVGACSCHFVSE